MLGAGVLRAALLPVDRRSCDFRLFRAPTSRLVRRGGRAAAAILVIVAVALGAGAGSFAAREYDRFVSDNAEPGAEPDAGTAHRPGQRRPSASCGGQPCASSTRRSCEELAPAPTSSTTFATAPNAPYVTDAHSLYLQSLAELGIVGFALILVVVLAILGGLAARIRGPDRPLYAALFATALAWAVHQALDWDWQMPAVTLGVFILAGMALARPRDGRPGRRGLPANRSLVAFGWLVLAVAPLLAGISYARLQRSGRDLRRGDCVSAKREALSSLSLSAKRPQSYVIIGVCDLEQGFAQAAVPAMAKAASLEPDSWEEQYWLAVAQAGAGIDPGPAIQRALVLNPLRARSEEHRPAAGLEQPAAVGTDRAAPTQPGAELGPFLDHQSLSGVGKRAARSYRG